MNMLRLRRSSDSQPRWKNGNPAHSTTGVARTSCNQFASKPGCGSISNATTGTVSAAPIHRRRRHVGEFRIGLGFGADGQRLQRHAADRTTAGADLADLGVHRAGIGGRRFGGRVVARRSGTGPGRRRICRGSRRSRNGTCRRHARSDGAMWRDRPSCRRPGRSPGHDPPSRPRGDRACAWHRFPVARRASAPVDIPLRGKVARCTMRQSNPWQHG